jgi:hypothetical protein
LLRKNIAGDLLAQKLIVGLVGIEGVNDIIPVTPCQPYRVICRVTGGVGVTDDVQPVASPALAVSRRTQEAVDYFREGVGGMVRGERLDFLGSRRKTG